MPIFSFSAHDLRDRADAKLVTYYGLAIPSGNQPSAHSTGLLYLPLHFPEGAVVNRIRIFYRDNHAGGGAEVRCWWIVRNHRSMEENRTDIFTSSGSDPEMREADYRHALDPINNERSFYHLEFRVSRHHDTLGIYSGLIYYQLP